MKPQPQPKEKTIPNSDGYKKINAGTNPTREKQTKKKPYINHISYGGVFMRSWVQATAGEYLLDVSLFFLLLAREGQWQIQKEFADVGSDSVLTTLFVVLVECDCFIGCFRGVLSFFHTIFSCYYCRQTLFFLDSDMVKHRFRHGLLSVEIRWCFLGSGGGDDIVWWLVLSAISISCPYISLFSLFLFWTFFTSRWIFLGFLFFCNFYGIQHQKPIAQLHIPTKISTLF